VFIGHAALAMAAKPLAPRASLGVAIAATYWLDLVWPVLVLVFSHWVLDALSHRPDLPLWGWWADRRAA
jgi:hypothetical protein